MKLGLFGGTFNPIHHCHLQIAAAVRDRLRLDRILFIPTGDPPHKAPHSLAPALDRLEMVRLAVAGTPSFAVCDVEVLRRSTSYSIDTVLTLRNRHQQDDLHFLIGLDAFLEFQTWREPARLLRLCHFVVVSRPGVAFRDLTALNLLPPLPEDALVQLDEGQHDLLRFSLTPETSLILLRLPPCETSASEIRRRLREHRPLSNQLPASVMSYIIRAKLYQEDTDHRRV